MNARLNPSSLPVRGLLNRLRARPTRGMTMIELMIGLVLGAATTVLIAQVMASTEQQRRATSSGSDTQINGALALFDLQRSIMAAGYGMTSRRDAFGCELRARFNNATNFTWRFEPMRIVNGALGGPDEVIIYGSTKDSFASPLRVRDDHNGLVDVFSVNTNVGVDNGDIFIAVPLTPSATNWCSVLSATATTANTITHGSGAGSPWNQPVGSYIFPAVGYDGDNQQPSTALVNMGSMMVRTVKVAGNQNLVEEFFDTNTATTTTAEPLYPNIVNFQAYYGKDTDAPGANDTVDTYNSTQPTTSAQWAQVRTVRIVVVTRDPKWEKDEVTATSPVLRLAASPPVEGAVACGTEQCISFDVSALADWKHYRYQIHESVVPLRNLLWNL